jgi:hypothetical protein
MDSGKQVSVTFDPQAIEPEEEASVASVAMSGTSRN